jgi:carboxylesterase type B
MLISIVLRRERERSKITILNITFQHTKIITQVHSLGPVVLGSEDCLYLDVYRPSDATLTNLPVFYDFHKNGANLQFVHESIVYSQLYVVN